MGFYWGWNGIINRNKYNCNMIFSIVRNFITRNKFIYKVNLKWKLRWCYINALKFDLQYTRDLMFVLAKVPDLTRFYVLYIIWFVATSFHSAKSSFKRMWTLSRFSIIYGDPLYRSTMSFLNVKSFLFFQSFNVACIIL